MPEVYNFNPGPAILPRPVLETVQTRTSRLPRSWHVDHRDEPSLQGIHGDRGRG